MSEEQRGGGRLRVVLLCAGEIGYRAVGRVLESEASRLVGVFTYRVEPPQEGYLELIKRLCGEHGVPVYESANAGREEFREVWARLRPDYIFTLKWRTMVPRWVMEAARGGLVGFHASLLPMYRGFAPVNWPIINGEERTGLSMFYAAEGVDEGDIIEQRERALTDADDAGTLDAWVTETAVEMLAENLPRLADGTAPRRPQDHSQATYAVWRGPEDGRIDWSRPTREVFNLVRGLTSPYPGAYSLVGGRKLTVWSAEVEPRPRRYVGRIPGKVEAIIPGEGVNVLTGDGTLRLKLVQFEGEEPRNASEVITRLRTKLD
ncbi:MAG TPA: methionyl-tRNA formyltransferase [Pyrinomonadaceae bacterium]|nr:methionyl-tRNA formyltransferase [Pyrinomonadaceae bacterium]